MICFDCFLIQTMKFGILFLSIQKQRLEESDINQEKLKSSVKVLMEEKEELAMVVQLQLFFSFTLLWFFPF